jgi:hypothetical protein
LRVLQDSSGHVLQYDLLGLAIRPWHRRRDVFTGYWALAALARRIGGKRGGDAVRAVRLLSRRHAEVGEIEFIEDDLTQPNALLEARFDIVRAANILNRGYFEGTTLSRMLSTLVAYARGPGSLLVLNRTHEDGTNHGSILQLQATGKLALLERVGNGSEIEALALAAAPRG